MRLFVMIVLVTYLDLPVKAGPYIGKCRPRIGEREIVTFQQFDVTNDSSHIYSHDGYIFGYTYRSSYTRCIYIWTNNTDYVIKLDEIDFETQDTLYCNADGLITYYTTFEEADDLNFEEKFCGSKGPGTKYSTANYMFLYFSTDENEIFRGFEFVISSIHKDDVPDSGLSTGAIVGIVFGVLALIAITIAVVIIVILIWRRKKKSDSQQADEQSHEPANRTEVVALRNSTTTASATTDSNENQKVDDDEPPPYESCIGLPP